MLFNRKLHYTVGYFLVSIKYIVNYDCTIVDYLYNWPLMWLNKETYSGGSSGLVVMGEDSCSEGRGFESRCHILDGHFFTLICCKIVLILV